MIFDPMYLVFAAPGILLALWATTKTKSTFRKYSRVMASSRVTGAQAARQLLDANGCSHVQVERVDGFLSDHYDPRSRTLRLSPDVYDQPSLAAIGVACHEAGHAFQHASGYVPLQIRSAIVPLTTFGSSTYIWVIMAGFLFQFPQLIDLGILLFAAVVVFSLVTLPVEWDASARAKRHMVSAGIVSQQESGHASAVLNAAFMTYVASAVSAILTLAYYVFLRGRD